MAMFVHLAPASRLALIRRNGLARSRHRDAAFCGVFAVPVTRYFSLSHQWLRELRRHHRGPFAGVYFRVPDAEQVWVGHYNRAHRWLSAAEAVAEFAAASDGQGWQVVIPRRVEAGELHRVRRLPQVVGWRFSPEAKGKPPFCTCKFCNRGDYGWQRTRARLGATDE